MFCDDGLGVFAAEYLKRNYHIPFGVDIIDGGALGFGLMTLFREYDLILILSTTSEGKSGEIFHFCKAELLEQGSIRQSANEVEVAQMLEICSILDDDEMAEIEIVAMHPGDIVPVETNVTPIVRKSFASMVEKALAVLRRHHIELQQTSSPVSLDTVIEHYANPQQSFYH